LSGLSFDGFSKNKQVIRAVTMDLVIIGEAAKHLPAETRRKCPQISWSKIIGMRNIFTHEYPETDIRILWKTAEKSLPELKEAINELLHE
jgi:uncharacterized protein with HEPN domain